MVCTVEAKLSIFVGHAKKAFLEPPLPTKVLIDGDHVGDIWDEVKTRFVAGNG